MKNKLIYVLFVLVVLSLVTTSCKPFNSLDGLKLSKDSISIEVGESQQLDVIAEPEDAKIPEVTWYSSDEKIATVDINGLVKAFGPGNVTIEVISKDGKYSASSNVTVAPKSIKTFELDKSSVSIEVGKTEKLNLNIEPKDALIPEIQWSTSDEKIASVDNTGIIKANSIGQASLYAKTGDGKFTVNIIIDVKATPASGINLNKKSLSLEVGSNEKLSATIEPANATNKKVAWSSSNTSVATVNSDGEVKALAAGNVKIVAKSEDGGFLSECTLTVKNKTQEKSQNNPKPKKYPIIVKNKGPHTGEIAMPGFQIPPNTTKPYKLLFKESNMGYLTITLTTRPEWTEAILESHDLEIYLTDMQLYINRKDHSSTPTYPCNYYITVTSRRTGEVLFKYIPE